MKDKMGYFSIFVFIGFILLAGFISWKNSEPVKTAAPTKDNIISSDSISRKINIDVKKFIVQIQEIRETRYHHIVQIPDTEYVEHNKGRYFIIDLKDTISGKVILFPEGEYTFNNNDWLVLSAFDEVYNTIISKISKNVKCKIFIEGQADKKGDNSFVRTFEPGFAFTQIVYNPKVLKTNDRFISYSNREDTLLLKEPLRNSDLPLLRGNFLKIKISQYPEMPQLVLLEGGVSSKTGPEYRNGKILLFIADENRNIRN
jgi:hypothetical protein